MIPLRTRTFLFAAVLGALAAAPAHAFTLQDSNGNTGQVNNWMDLDSKSSVDLDKPSSRFNDGQTTIKQGNSTLQFGSQRSFNQRFNSDYLFNPYFRDGQQ